MTRETIERQREKLQKTKVFHETHLRRVKQQLDALDKKADEVEAQQLVDWIREKNIPYDEAMRLLSPQAGSQA